jgi:hypothetical protein
MSAKPKKYSDAALEGGAGIGVIKTIVSLMRHNIYEAGGVEVGIDGSIELVDPKSKAATAKILFFQSKAHDGAFDDETDQEFTYKVRQSDLDYWMELNNPILLILSRPKSGTNEAYWLPVQEYFAEPDIRESRLARFDKRANALTAGSTPEFFAVFERDQARKAEALESMVRGPLQVLGLSTELAEAEAAEEAGEAAQAAEKWVGLAEALAGRLPAPFSWPAFERAAGILRNSGKAAAAIAIYKRLARERLELDDPAADFDLQRAMTYGAGGDFEFAMLATRASLPERGIEVLSSLRELLKEASNAAERREAAVWLSDALLLYGYWKEAVKVADKVALRLLNSPEKRALLADRCDAAGELGEDTEADWERLLDAAEAAGPVPYGLCLQRRGVYLTRHGRVGDAQANFRLAAEVWAKVPGAEEQAAEALISVETCAEVNGRRPAALPFGSRVAAGLIRGQVQTPAVRAERLMSLGAAYLANMRYPDAIKHLTLALIVERRAGDLFGIRRTLQLVARAWEAVDEPREALRWWIQAGLESRAKAVAGELDFDSIQPLLRLADGPAWERSASFSALTSVAKELNKQQVRKIAVATVMAAEPMPAFIAPQPSFHARQALCAVAPNLPDAQLEKAEAAIALGKLSRAGRLNAMPFIFDQVLKGNDLPVAIAGFIRTAPKTTQKRLVKAALAGSRVALVEAARADLPETFPALRGPCGVAVRASIASEAGTNVEYLGANFSELGELGRHSSRPTQVGLSDFLVEIVESERFDHLSKMTALISIASLAPALPTATAERALNALLPFAAGEEPPTAEGVFQSHPNPKLARASINRSPGPDQFRASLLQACGRLAHHVDPASTTLAAAFDTALEEGSKDLTLIVLHELRQLGNLPVAFDVTVLQQSSDPEIAAAAVELAG